MSDDLPIAFDEDVQAAIERAHKRIAERNGTDVAEATLPAFDVDVEATPVERTPADTGRAECGANLGTLEEHARHMGDVSAARSRQAREVADGPTIETLTEKWGLVYEDAQLIRGASKTTAFKETMAIRCAREFLAEAAGGVVKIMVLTGTRGVGKTVAAAWTMVVARPEIGRSWPTERHPVMISASKIAMWGSYGYAAEREQLARCRVLVIDELGIEDDTRGFRPYLNELMNQRAGAAGYTVITCNLTTGEMLGRYGPRIMDRLRQRGAWFEIDHPSLRVR